MARDIEEFLRRAAERRQQQKNQSGQSGSPVPPKQSDPNSPQDVARQAAARQAMPPLEEVEVEIVETRLASRPKLATQLGAQESGKSDLLTGSVSELVNRHLDTNQLLSRSQSLGNRIASIHDQVDRNVHKHLDHDICSVDAKNSSALSVQAKVANQATTQIADDLLKILANPGTIRQSILISEILNRPNFDDE